MVAPRLTVDEIIAALKAMPEGLRHFMDSFPDAGVTVEWTIKTPDEHGNRLRLVCGIEYVAEDEDDE